MRPIGLLLFIALFFALLCHASSIDKKPIDPVALTALAAKASLAQPKDQCFLYAELVHQMTEFAGHQLSQGEDPSATLRAVRDYTQKIHLGRSSRQQEAQERSDPDGAHLLPAERDSAFGRTLDDRPLLESTLKTLNQVQNELMMQVFRH